MPCPSDLRELGSQSKYRTDLKCQFGLSPGTIDSWDLLKKAFIQRYCPPSKTAKQLKEIRNFKQEGDETLYQAWERYNDMLYKCPTHDINSHQKMNIFYNGLGTMNRQLLDSQGPIPSMTHAQTLTAIQTMADHSQKWHNGSSSRNVDSSSNSKGIAAIVNKLKSLGRNMKKLKENVHATQVGCQTCGGANLDKECPLNKEVKNMEEVKYGEFGRPFPNNSRNDVRFNRGASGYDQPSSGERRPSLTEIINKYMEEAAKRHAKQDEWLKKFYQNTETNQEAHDKIIQDLEMKEIEYFSANSGFFYKERQETDKSGMTEARATLEAKFEIKKVPQEEKQSVNYYVDPYDPPIPFPKQLEHRAEEALDLVANKPSTEEDEEIRMNPRCSALLQNQLPPKEQDLESFILPCSIGRLDFNNALADLGASISVMPFSMYKRLGRGKLEPINTVIEMADNTKCTPKGIVENLLIKIDKFIFPIDFVILDMVEDFRKPIILGTLASHCTRSDMFSYEINIQESYEEIVYMITEVDKETYSTPKEKSSVCDGGGLPINEEKRYWESINDSKREGLEWEELSLNDLMKIRYGKVCKMTKERILKDHWREKFREEEDDIEENSEDPKECEEDKSNTIIGDIHDKLNDDWFNGTSEDEDDLEGILDYLKPRSYDGFIDLDNEAYNKSRCRLLGLTYEEPP
ncbi:reverse transcriptase domain-containing protein [Tanacetum coccineum]